MATHKLNKASDATWNIDVTDDTWILGENGRIETVNLPGILMENMIDAATIRIEGDVAASGTGFGAYLEGARADLEVVKGAGISGEFAVIYNNSAGSFSLSNSGTLHGKNGYGVYAYAKQGAIDISNQGRVIADDYGIRTTGAGADIVNTGTIKAGNTGIRLWDGVNDADPLLADNASRIVNKGVIAGEYYSINATDVAVNIRNRGILNGDVTMGAGDDVVDTRGGVINGTIFGGGGNDVITLSSPAQVYSENVSEGFDTVRINATYQLGENIENLTLLGKANHAGIGNSLSNTLAGNKGANALYGLDGDDTLFGGKGDDRLYGQDGNDELDGGAGADRLFSGLGDDLFIFKAGYGRDTIMDFAAGDDRIGIAGSGFASFDDFFNAGNVQTVGNDIVLVFSDTDRLVLKGEVIDGTVLTSADFAYWS